MPSPRTKQQPLSDTEIRQISDDLAGGRPPMVWFTPAAVGVSEGRSGKVVALGDPSEGDFLQVRPTGSSDVMSFSPTEVTMIKPARKDKRTTSRPAGASEPATRKDTAVSTSLSRSSTSSSPSSTSSSASPAPVKSQAQQQAPELKTEQKPETKPAAEPAAKSTSASTSTSTPRPAKSAAARKSRTPEVTLTLSGTADGEWTVDVVHGKKRTIKGLSVSGSAVSQASKLLHPDVADVVDTVLDAVRNTQRVKVEQLQSELDQARRMLDDLSG